MQGLQLASPTPTESSVSCNNLSVATTCEHLNSMLSATRLQPIGRGRKSMEPCRSSLGTPGPATLQDPGAPAASPEAAPPGTPKPAPRITKSYSEPPASSLGWGMAKSTSTLVAPSNAPSALGTSCTSASHTSGLGSSDARVSHGPTTGRNDPGGAMAMSFALTADNATRSTCMGMSPDVLQANG